jgi:hypothetical protein
VRIRLPSIVAALLLSAVGCSGSNPALPPILNPNVFPFKTVSNIGSIVDPTNGDKNPYGLAFAPVDAGLFTSGDLVLCNFNDSANVQGNGTSVEYIHPQVGATVHRLAQGASLKGCGAVALLADARVLVTADVANDVVIFDANGTLKTTLSGAPFNGPWGAAFAASATKPAVYVSNANDGKLIRINVTGTNSYTVETIATGFSVNNGAPGNIFAPYGMAYNPANDTLYIVETNSNKLIAIANVSGVPAGGITVSGGDATFGGSSASSARVVLSGAPLNSPLGASLLANGNIVVANSGDNLMIDVMPSGSSIGTISLDNGAAGALFSLAGVPGTFTQQFVYFDDSNDNTLKVVTP